MRLVLEESRKHYDLEVSMRNEIEKQVEEVIDNYTYEPQAAIRFAYDHQFDFGLHIGAGVTQFFNSTAIGDDNTAPTLTVGYKLGPKAPSRDLTYSPDDAILGAPDSDGSLSLSLKIAF